MKTSINISLLVVGNFMLMVVLYTNAASIKLWNHFYQEDPAVSTKGCYPASAISKNPIGDYYYGVTGRGGKLRGSIGIIYRLNPLSFDRNIYHVKDFNGMVKGPYSELVRPTYVDGKENQKFFGTSCYSVDSEHSDSIFSFDPTSTEISRVAVPDAIDQISFFNAPPAIDNKKGFYGLARSGGDSNHGAIYEVLAPSTSNSRIDKIASFHNATVGSQKPFYAHTGFPPLIIKSERYLWGFNPRGSHQADYGTVYRFDIVSKSFKVNSSDFKQSKYKPTYLFEGPNNVIFGIAQSHQSADGSFKLFRVEEPLSDNDPIGIIDVLTVNDTNTYGKSVVGVTFARNGYLYIVNAQGGKYEYGCIIKVKPDGSSLTVLDDFDDSSGFANAQGPVVEIESGLFIGIVDGIVGNPSPVPSYQCGSIYILNDGYAGDLPEWMKDNEVPADQQKDYIHMHDDL